MKSWYTITNLARDEAEVYVYSEIGMFGLTADDFAKDLAAIKAKAITLRINSRGGDVFEGIAIHNALKRHSARVTAVVDGLAASIASVIAMAGDTVVMSPHAQLMIHDAQGFAGGSVEDLRKFVGVLDQAADNIASIYAERAGGTTASWRGKMKSETWYTDREAVDAGLADSILGEGAAPRKRAAAVDWRSEVAGVLLHG